MRYRPEIDGLRAVAVLPVILFHAGFRVFSGGFVGVDVFFVISGYLITSIILAERNAGTFTLTSFYERRARRILPALFVVMLACLPFSWLWLLPQDMKEFAQSLIAVPLFVSNFLFWKASGYFEIAAELKPLLHTWSLAVEEQYYLLFPLLIALLWRFARHAIWVALLALFALSLGLAQWASSAKPDAAYYLLLTRGWELLLGSFVALYLARSGAPATGRAQSELGGFLGLLLLAYSIFFYDNQTPFPSIYALAPTLGAALIIVYANGTTTVGKLLSWKPAVAVGLISYSAYLWHQPLLVFARHRSFEGLHPALAGTLVGLTLVLATLSWKYIETPFRNKERIGRRQIFGFSLAGMAFFIAIGAAGTLTDGFNGRFHFISAHDGDVGQKAFYERLDGETSLCPPKDLANDPKNRVTFRCLQSHPEHGAPSIALIGDSHAEHLYLGLAEQLPEENALLYARGSYPSINNPQFSKIFDFALSTPQLHHVLISAHWFMRAEEIPKDSTLERELGQTVDALRAAGKTVYFVGDVPRFPFPPERCKFVAEGLGRSVCTAPIAFVRRYEKTYAPALQRFLHDHPQVRFIDLQSVFCSPTDCSMLLQGSLAYRDHDHLNIVGSEWVGRLLVNRLQ